MPISPGKTYIEELIKKENSCVLSLGKVSKPNEPPSYYYIVRSYLENKTEVSKPMEGRDDAIAEGQKMFEAFVAVAKHIGEVLKDVRSA